MNIYIASSWRNTHQPAFVYMLRKWGYKVYDFRNPRPGENGFFWSEIDEKWQDWLPEEFRDALDTPPADAGFCNDMLALRHCDLVVLLLPSGRSAHTEAGWASGHGKPVVVYIDQHTNTEPELMYKMFDDICINFRELEISLKRHRDAARVSAINQDGNK
jgi:hypothetical protein